MRRGNPPGGEEILEGSQKISMGSRFPQRDRDFLRRSIFPQEGRFFLRGSRFPQTGLFFLTRSGFPHTGRFCLTRSGFPRVRGAVLTCAGKSSRGFGRHGGWVVRGGMLRVASRPQRKREQEQEMHRATPGAAASSRKMRAHTHSTLNTVVGHTPSGARAALVERLA